MLFDRTAGRNVSCPSPQGKRTGDELVLSVNPDLLVHMLQPSSNRGLGQSEAVRVLGDRVPAHQIANEVELTLSQAEDIRQTVCIEPLADSRAAQADQRSRNRAVGSRRPMFRPDEREVYHTAALRRRDRHEGPGVAGANPLQGLAHQRRYPAAIGRVERLQPPAVDAEADGAQSARHGIACRDDVGFLVEQQRSWGYFHPPITSCGSLARLCRHSREGEYPI